MRRLSVALIFTFSLIPATLWGYSYEVDSLGSPITLDQKPSDRHTVTTLECSIPPGTQTEADAHYAGFIWNRIRGVWDKFITSSRACPGGGVSVGDGHSDIYWSSNANPGAIATAKKHYRGGGLFSSIIHVDEFDVRLNVNESDEYSQGRPICDNGERRLATRHVVTHEIGHALALRHQTRFATDAVAVMRTGSENDSPYCGLRRVMPHPDEAAFARRFYASGNPSSDMAMNGYRVNVFLRRFNVGGNRILLIPSATIAPHLDGSVNPVTQTVDVCPGETRETSFSESNLGESQARYARRVVLSTNDFLSLSDPVLKQTSGLSQGAHSFRLREEDVQIPTGFSTGKVLFQGVIAVHDDAPSGDWCGADEWTCQNNVVRLFTRFEISEFCP